MALALLFCVHVCSHYSRAVYVQGFVAVLEDFNELVLDVPDAADVMALFIGRAIVDEILPPAFLERLTPPPGSELERCKRAALAHMRALHSAERLLRCWGSGAPTCFNSLFASPPSLSAARHTCARCTLSAAPCRICAAALC